MSAVFADTFYFLGLLNRADQAHARCVSFSNSFRGEVVTTSSVLVEVADALAAPTHRVQAGRFIQSLRTKPRVRIIPALPSLLERGLRLYLERPDKDWSLTDCISFTVMMDERITEAATGDHHFNQAGFTTLLKED